MVKAPKDWTITVLLNNQSAILTQFPYGLIAFELPYIEGLHWMSKMQVTHINEGNYIFNALLIIQLQILYV